MTTATARRQTIHPDDLRFGNPGAREALLAWCTENGVDGDRVARISVRASSVEFVVYLRNEQGSLYRDGDNIAHEVVVVDAPTPLPETWR